MKNLILLSLAIFFVMPMSAYASCDHLAGRWVNARGSAILLENANEQTGKFGGQFVSEASIEDGAVFPIVGWLNKTAATQSRPDVVQSLSFTVRWGATGSITAWTGYCRETETTTEISTLWHLVRSASENDFDHIHAGSDIFVRETPSKP